MALFGVLGFMATVAVAQTGNGETGVINFLEPKLSDPVLQHDKEIYVLNGCAYCHGVDLKVRNGEAADLLHSSVVAADVDGSVLVPLLRAGIPQTAKLSPMPQFSDLSDQELADIVQWIHYARQDGRYNELTTQGQQAPSGNAEAGKAYFDENCASCHSKQGDLARAVGKYQGGGLKVQVLRPDALQGVASWSLDSLHDTKKIDGRKRHQKLLENYSADDVANVVSYLEAK